MTPLPYAGSNLPGVLVLRIIGLLVAALAGNAIANAFASEDPHGTAGLARFAYVNSSVFQASFGVPVPKRPLEPTREEAANSDEADFRPVLLVAAQAIASDPIEIAESAQAVAMDGIGTVTLVGDVDSPPAAQAPPQQLASLEPSSLFQVSAPPAQETAPQFAALEPPAAISESEPPLQEPARDIAREFAQQNTALKPSVLPPDSVAVAHDAPQKIAAVEPSSIVSGGAPDEILASRPELPVHAPPLVKRTRHQRAAHATSHKRARVAKKKVASATVPKWATKMFDGPWQTHAFAYQ